MTITCFADEIAESYETDWEQAIWLFRDRIRRNQKLIESDYAFTAAHLNWDKVKTNTQFREVGDAMTLMAIIGTPEQQAAKREAAQVAAEIASKEVPKHRAKAEEHTSKADAFERDAKLAQQRVEHTDEALAKLPNVAPGYVRKRVAAAETLLNTQGVGAELRAAKARLHELTCVLNLGGVYDSVATHIDYGLRRLCPDAVTSTVRGGMMSYHYSPEWPSLKAAAETEYAEITARIPELQAAFDTALAAVQKPLTDYFFTNSDN
jgi:hypothetical protein